MAEGYPDWEKKVATSTDTGAGVYIGPPATPRNAKVTVASAGTRVPLSSSSVPIQSVTVIADEDNTGDIYIGDSSVSSSNGFKLHPGSSVSLDISDLAVLYIDADTGGDSVRYLVVS